MVEEHTMSDLQRGSGRTTRMLRLAADEAVRGNLAYVVMARAAEFDYAVRIVCYEYRLVGARFNARSNVVHIANERIKFVSMDNYSLDWDLNPPRIKGMPNAPVFVDHHVWEVRSEEMNRRIRQVYHPGCRS